MYKEIAAGLVKLYTTPHPPPGKIINNLNADYHVKPHHEA